MEVLCTVCTRMQLTYTPSCVAGLCCSFTLQFHITIHLNPTNGHLVACSMGNTSHLTFSQSNGLVLVLPSLPSLIFSCTFFPIPFRTASIHESVGSPLSSSILLYHPLLPLSFLLLPHLANFPLPIRQSPLFIPFRYLPSPALCNCTASAARLPMPAGSSRFRHGEGLRSSLSMPHTPRRGPCASRNQIPVPVQGPLMPAAPRSSSSSRRAWPSSVRLLVPVQWMQCHADCALRSTKPQETDRPIDRRTTSLRRCMLRRLYHKALCFAVVCTLAAASHNTDNHLKVTHSV